MINTKTRTTLAAAAAMFALSGVASVSHAQAGGAEAGTAATVHCYGVNSCKGQSDCKSYNHDCKGQNDCKGQGFKAETKAQCKTDGGKLNP